MSRKKDPPADVDIPLESPKGVKLFWEASGEWLANNSYRNARNALLMLEPQCKHDTFHNRKYVEEQELSDGIVRNMRDIIIDEFKFDPGKGPLQEALERLCDENGYDPIVDYLASMEAQWDGKDRLENFLQIYFGAEDTELNSLLGLTHMIAGAHRPRHPGARYDLVPVLNGEEGLGKSTALEKLYGRENFSDQKLLGLRDQQLQEQTRSVWGYELGELDGMEDTPLERLKMQISRTEDRSREAYGRFVVWQPRRCVFIGTTNEQQYLKGRYNRRWIPVRVTKADVEGIIRDRDMLWAEAAVKEKALVELGLSLALPQSVWSDAAKERELRTTHDPWEEILSGITPGKPYPDGDGGWEFRVSTYQVQAKLAIPTDRLTVPVAKRIAKAMRAIGWENALVRIRCGPTNNLLSDPGRGYRRPIPQEHWPKDNDFSEAHPPDPDDKVVPMRKRP